VRRVSLETLIDHMLITVRKMTNDPGARIPGVVRGGGRGGGWGLCVAAVAGCGAAGRFRRLGFGARGRAAVAPIAVLALASHALGRGTLRGRAGTRRRWGGGMRGPGSSGRGWRALGCTRCLRGQGGVASTSGLRCRASEGRSGSGCPGRRTQGPWAYACRALTM